MSEEWKCIKNVKKKRGNPCSVEMCLMFAQLWLPLCDPVHHEVMNREGGEQIKFDSHLDSEQR